MPRTETDVVVAGAGAAGLAAAAALERRGVRPIVLEADERVGGSWARRYDRLHLHTVRRFSGLPHRPLPRTLPRYVPKDAYGDYLADYARSLGLDVRLGHRVEAIRQEDSRWLVHTNGGAWLARVVVVATGKHNRPRLPSWPGRGEFRGRIVHSAAYRSADGFRDRRVLVVGLGNSGAEIAAELAEAGAAFVAVAVRTPPPIVRRDMAGIPVQLLGMLLMPFPARPVDRLGAAVRKVAVGDLSRYGLGAAAWGPFEARRPPTIDVGFLDVLKRRQVQVRPDVTRFTADGVVFADGRSEPYDAVVAATGFTTGLAGVLDAPDVLDERGQPRFARDGSSAQPGLYFIGFVESARGALFEANRGSRRLAAAVAAYLGG
jgi:putative flavoprotein involved in K+ transport